MPFLSPLLGSRCRSLPFRSFASLSLWAWHTGQRSPDTQSPLLLLETPVAPPPSSSSAYARHRGQPDSPTICGPARIPQRIKISMPCSLPSAHDDHTTPSAASGDVQSCGLVAAAATTALPCFPFSLCRNANADDTDRTVARRIHPQIARPHCPNRPPSNSTPPPSLSLCHLATCRCPIRIDSHRVGAITAPRGLQHCLSAGGECPASPRWFAAARCASRHAFCACRRR